MTADDNLLDAHPVPSGSAVVQIGPMKTGTTAVQRAASQARDRLLEFGVLYPGSGLNHGEALIDFFGFEAKAAGRPGVWDALYEEIDSTKHDRLFLSHEFVAEADAAGIDKLRTVLDRPLYALITVRSLPAIIPSFWQQSVKWRNSYSFTDWLEAVLVDPVDESVTPRFHRHTPFADIVERWCDVLGPDNVTVAVSDKAHPNRIFDVFSKILSIPTDTLSTSGADESNVSLSFQQAEFLRRINAEMKKRSAKGAVFSKVVRGGVLKALQATGPSSSQPIVLPRWAQELAQEMGEAFATRISATGAHVVGDLNVLALAGQTSPQAIESPQVVSIEEAVAAVLGVFDATRR
ncbi:hypothetical protein [Spelaeicoccus albus]|uniref:Sulfotransferase family protein n=1 Tax=Spelaeicoccus albus TaxID=1280376 RepID=A0A7Z0A8R6_9MICO|nr:hypothetical protein [Spelaeicoccus albus]NYI66464.1 hypothetical protein [Spelaeicoccus albus]